MARARRKAELDADLAWSGFFKDADWMFKVGIGGTINAAALVLAVAHPLFIPVVCALFAVVSGYLLRLIRFKMLDPECKLPPWDDWLELIVSGMTWLAIQFGYYLAVASTITTTLLIGAGSGRVTAHSPEFVPWALISIFLVAAISLTVSFISPFLMVNFAVEERIAAGFALRKVYRRTRNNPRNMLLAWLLSTGLLWAAAVLPALTLIGIFFLPSTVFIAQVLSAVLATQVWGSDKQDS